MADRFSSEIVAVITATEWDTEPDETVLRIALYGGVYADTVNPTGPAVHYNGRIKSDVILRKRIGVSFWNEDSSIDFGYLDIAIEDQNAAFVQFARYVTIATVDIYRVNLSDATEDQLSLLSSSRCSDIGFVDEDTIRLRLESILQGGFNAPINSLYYDATYPELEGKPYPIAWANITDPNQIMPTIFVDPIYLTYHFTDLDIVSFDGDVYDRGIVLTDPTGYIPAAYGVELQNNPDGRITIGAVTLDDPEDPGNDFTGLYRFFRLAFTRAGLWSNVDTLELGSLVTAIGKGDIYPEFFTQEVVDLERFVGDVFRGVGAWHYVDELSEIHFGLLTDPDVESPTLAFTDAHVIGDIKVEDDKAPGLSTRISHGQSPGKYGQDELAGGVSNADRLLLAHDIYTAATTEPVIPFYEKASAREPTHLLMSYSEEVFVETSWRADTTAITADDTDATADGYAPGGTPTTSIALAQNEVDRWWADLYPRRRRFYSFNISMEDPLFNDNGVPQLGEFFTLQSETFDLLETEKNLLLRGVTHNYSQNLITFEGWG